MKKYTAVIFVLLLLFVFTSCKKADDNTAPIKVEPTKSQSQQNDTVPPSEQNTNNQDNTDDSYFGQYQMSEEGFSEQVKDNAIDKDYEIESAKLQQSSMFSTQAWVELEDKYIKIWDKELNNNYNKLLKKLSEKEQKKLREAQIGWLQFHINESEFVGESWNDFGLGSQGRVQLEIASKERLRERTLQLMEYDYMLNGEVEFLYKSVNK